MARWENALTDVDIVQIRIQSAEGADHERLAETFGRTERYINQIVSGEVHTHLPLVEGRTRRLRARDIAERVVSLRGAGLRQGEIARQLGCAQSTVSRILKETFAAENA